jgi:hypothetical protein
VAHLIADESEATGAHDTRHVETEQNRTASGAFSPVKQAVNTDLQNAKD